MNSEEIFEIKAAAFYEMTGFVAPGKDSPSAIRHSLFTRTEAKGVE